MEKGVIDNSTYRLAINEDLAEKPFPLPQIAPHLLARAIDEHGEGKIYHSTIKKNIQLKADELLNKHISSLSPNQLQ
jgi:penicillin-binding protein 1C